MRMYLHLLLLCLLLATVSVPTLFVSASVSSHPYPTNNEETRKRATEEVETSQEWHEKQHRHGHRERHDRGKDGDEKHTPRRTNGTAASDGRDARDPQSTFRKPHGGGRGGGDDLTPNGTMTEEKKARYVQGLRDTCSAVNRGCNYDFDCQVQKCPECGLCFVCRGGMCSCDICW